MLSTLLGVILAFITVILLLSMVVMALVQMTQALLRLRGRNLLVGVAAVLQSQGLSGALPTKSRPLSPKQDTNHAAEVLNATAGAALKRKADPNSLSSVLRGPAVVSVDAHDLARAIREVHGAAAPMPPAMMAAAAAPGLAAGPVASAAPDPIAEAFTAIEPGLKDRFTRNIRILTACWGLVVAVLFQVDSPALLRMLSTSEAKRDAIVAMVPSVIKQADSTVPSAMANDFVDRALSKLASRYPNRQDLAQLFPQVSGDTDSRGEMLDELRSVLTGVSDRDEIVRQYGEIIDSTATHDLTTAIHDAGVAMDSLEVVDIRPWAHGGTFYGDFSNIIGVLITTILLSFGAPFWFEQLKNVANLRDALSRKKDPQNV